MTPSKVETKGEPAESGLSVMKRVIDAYQKIIVSPEFLEIERIRSIARREEAVVLRRARKEGKKQGIEQGIKQERENVARNALAEGVSIDLIKNITGLDDEALKHIQASQKE